MTPDIEITGTLPEATTAAVLDLVSAATGADSVGPLSEHVLLHLRYGGDPQARDLLLRTGGGLAGYAHLDLSDRGEGPSGELVIDPAHRRHGLGLALTEAVLAEAAPRPLRLWAHGDLPAASALASRAGFERIRALWMMRRSLRTPLGTPRFPEGVTLRTFAAGADEQAWLELNRKAFASHPEQGAWTVADLALREREPWFDPAGFSWPSARGSWPGFTGRRSTRPSPAVPRARTSRSARCMSSGWTPGSRAPGWAGRSP